MNGTTEYATLSKFLKRMDRFESDTDPMPADRVINSVDFLRDLAHDVRALAAYAAEVTMLYAGEIERKNRDAIGVFDKNGNSP